MQKDGRCSACQNDMGAYDFMWNSIQSGQISDLGDKVEVLEKNMSIAKQWIEYLYQRIQKYEEMLAHMPPEAMTEAEKTAYAFGYFKALEVERNKNGT